MKACWGDLHALACHPHFNMNEQKHTWKEQDKDVINYAAKHASILKTVTFLYVLCIQEEFR